MKRPKVDRFDPRRRIKPEELDFSNAPVIQDHPSKEQQPVRPLSGPGRNSQPVAPKKSSGRDAHTAKGIDSANSEMVQGGMGDVTKSRRPEATTDVTASVMQDVNLKLWREIVEETETHNSSLRMSAKEREQAEDVVRDLKRKHKIKTSMNELARLGLIFLIHDFKRRGAGSIIAEVKTS